LEALLRNGISHLKIESGIYTEELLGLINILSKTTDSPADIKPSEHIHYGTVEVRYQSTPSSNLELIDLADIAGVEANRYMDIYQAARRKKKLEVSGLQEIVNGFVNAFNSQSDAFLTIAPLRAMDEYTYTHSTNICLLNLAQAKVLGIEGQLLNDIGIAAMLHDVGKMFISPDILSKTDKLNEEEWKIMQQHPRLGAEYLINTSGVPYLAVVTAFEHHMRYDGQGYPQTARPWKQHLCSQITAISDTYDAIRTSRAYEESLNQDQIIEIMLNLAGNKLHPQLTYSFLQVLSQLDTSSKTKK
jgi:HD-GYP domain-containing protein (c-di-GMP phosphodiesterase class II)